jgi:hypothetical protein
MSKAFNTSLKKYLAHNQTIININAMKSKDFAALFPEIDKPQSLFTSLKKHCASKGFPEEELFDKLCKVAAKRTNSTSYLEQPEKYLRQVISNAIKSYYKKLVKERENIEEYKTRFKTEVEQPQEFDVRRIENIIRDFQAEMSRRNYSPIEILLVELMGKVITNLQGRKYRDFIEALYIEAERQNISRSNVRKIQERLRRRSADNNDLKGFFHSLSKADIDFANLLDILLENEPVANMELAAYRFSSEEMDKMLWLKRLFEGNQYSFNPDRFPEVYYDDFDKVKENFPEIEHYRQYDECLNPDLLGVYIYPKNNSLPCAQSREGIIILFKDRIERYSWLYDQVEKEKHSVDCREVINGEMPSDAQVNEDTVRSVRFVVLMHELGHWLSHWAVRDGRRWDYGFQLPNRRTKEALAQLTAYWAAESDPRHLQTLFDLSPKIESVNINGNAIYGGYVDLMNLPKATVLQRLSELRKYWILQDDMMLNFLKSKMQIAFFRSDANDFEEWVKAQKAEKPDAVFVEGNLKEAILTSEACANTFASTLDFQKLLDLSILEIEWIEMKDIKK